MDCTVTIFEHIQCLIYNLWDEHYSIKKLIYLFTSGTFFDFDDANDAKYNDGKTNDYYNALIGTYVFKGEQFQ